MLSFGRKNMQYIIVFIILFFICSYSSGTAEQKIKIYADEINIAEVDQRIIASGDAIAINENKIKNLSQAICNYIYLPEKLSDIFKEN